MSADGSDLLKMLAQELGKLPNHIAMEGHTDSKKYPAGATYGNWELSGDRANAARRIMQVNGIREDQVTAGAWVCGPAVKETGCATGSLEPANFLDCAVSGEKPGPECGRWRKS